MKLLVVSPDYASHVEPMLQIAHAWQRSTGPAVVATGPSVRPSVEQFGVGWTHLRLGRGSNAGVIRAEEQPAGEDVHLREFFAATRQGAVATLRHQALARRHDLLFEPDRVTADLAHIVSVVQPDRVLVDHVAFGARLALYALGIDAASIVLGHPSALPAPGELYGLPPAWPTTIQPTQIELDELFRICSESSAQLTDTANDVLRRLAPDRAPIADLTNLAGHPTIYMYPNELHELGRPLPAGAVSIGSLRRSGTETTLTIPSDFSNGDGVRVLVSLGTFMSTRDDVLATAVRAAHIGEWRLALASGSSPVDRLGTFPDGAIVAEHLPQVALLQHSDVLITHGGNNSVTEACAAGVPMVVLPMSTDQFAGAAAIERAGVGVVLDPNRLTAQGLHEAVIAVTTGTCKQSIGVIACSIANGGPVAAARAILGN